MKSNFKGTNYDLDTQVSKFMDAREERAARVASQNFDDEKETIKIPVDEEYAKMTKEEKRLEAQRMRDSVYGNPRLTAAARLSAGACLITPKSYVLVSGRKFIIFLVLELRN